MKKKSNRNIFRRYLNSRDIYQRTHGDKLFIRCHFHYTDNIQGTVIKHIAEKKTRRNRANKWFIYSIYWRALGLVGGEAEGRRS